MLRWFPTRLHAESAMARTFAPTYGALCAVRPCAARSRLGLCPRLGAAQGSLRGPKGGVGERVELEGKRGVRGSRRGG